MIFKDRLEAANLLAEKIKTLPLTNSNKIIVLGLPRGGVPIAHKIACELRVPLDVFLVRKIGVPWHEELAMGAITMGDIVVFNEDVISSYSISKDQVDKVIAIEKKELDRREKVYRKNKPNLDLLNKTVILVDDGIATGSTIKAAIKAIRQLGCKQLIVAIPVAPADSAHEIEEMADQFICLNIPAYFMAIGQFYEKFEQLEDETVLSYLT